MTVERFIAARYLRTQRKGLFTIVTTTIGVAGVMIGVAALITTLSVMNGFQSDIQAKVIGAQAHLIVYGDFGSTPPEDVAARIGRHPEVAATAPFALGQAIVVYRGRSTGAILKGLDPEREFRVNRLGTSLSDGTWNLGATKSSPLPGIVLGEELAKGLGAWLGDEVVLVSPQGADTAMGLLPKMKRFRIAGLLHTGYYEFDSSTAYADLPVAASFLGLKSRASGIEVRLTDLDLADRLAGELRTDMGLSFAVRTFRQMNRTLFAALRLEKYMMTLLLALIVLVAALNIASNLILMGTEKLRDIGIFKAMGATPGQIRRIFLWEGALIGGLGVGLGLALGLSLCFLIWRYPLVELPSDIYYLSRVPVRVEWSDVLTVAAGGLALCLFATVYPAWRTAKVPPAEAIRYG